ncbi:hypothetical protein [Paracoccus xiamenensis]|uniref:hypothetical protein n=1 Tax=Paracoccus xiamenensis TaxID=2714901 RepID=UPI00140D4C49|nr:hypothetical protein [Paracoccus xiamenensis]NHF73635.1 hypothetical protein [Paracoccus xiamenensis]
MGNDTARINLVGYFTTFMVTLGLLALVNSRQPAGAMPATGTYLLPLLVIVCLLFLALTAVVLSRHVLPGGRRWNSAQTEETLLMNGMLVACGMGALALAGYGLAAFGLTGAALWVVKSWALIYALCFAALAYYSRPARRGGFMAVAAVFLTFAIFGMLF